MCYAKYLEIELSVFLSGFCKLKLNNFNKFFFFFDKLINFIEKLININLQPFEQMSILLDAQQYVCWSRSRHRSSQYYF